MEQLKPLSADIVSSIRAARQKLSVDLSSKENNSNESFMDTRQQSHQLYRAGSSLVDKTITVLSLTT